MKRRTPRRMGVSFLTATKAEMAYRATIGARSIDQTVKQIAAQVDYDITGPKPHQHQSRSNQ